MANILDDAQSDLLRKEAKRDLQPFVGEDGTVTVSAPAHIISAFKA